MAASSGVGECRDFALAQNSQFRFSRRRHATGSGDIGVGLAPGTAAVTCRGASRKTGPARHAAGPARMAALIASGDGSGRHHSAGARIRPSSKSERDLAQQPGGSPPLAERNRPDRLNIRRPGAMPAIYHERLAGNRAALARRTFIKKGKQHMAGAAPSNIWSRSGRGAPDVNSSRPSKHTAAR